MSMRENVQEADPGLSGREADTEPDVYVEACVGGCGKVYDMPEPQPGFICRRCSMMGRS